MDKMKKYIQENENRLAIEEVEDRVWEQVRRSLPPPRPQKSLLRLKSFRVLAPFRFHRNRFRWTLALVLLLVAGCSFQVDSTTKQGELLLLSVDKKQWEGRIPDGSAAAILRSFTPVPDSGEPGAQLYIRFRPSADSREISRLRTLKGFRNLEAISIRTAIRESLLAAAADRYLNFRVTRPRADRASLERALVQELKNKGIDQLAVTVAASGFGVVFKATRAPGPAEPAPKPASPAKAKLPGKPEVFKEKQFLLTPQTSVTELEAAEKTLHQMGYIFRLDTILFEGGTLQRLSGFLKSREGQDSHQFDAAHFKSLRITVNHQDRKGAFSLEISTAPTPTIPYTEK